MEAKKRLVFFDILDQTPEVLDQYFDETRVELCEIATIGGERGIDILDISEYDGWDYLVVLSLDKKEELLRLLSQIGIEQRKVIFLGDMEMICENEEEINSILDPGYHKQLVFSRMVEEYEKYITGDYTVVTAEGCSYLHNSSDRLIMGSMYYTKINWAHDEIWRFYCLAQKYYRFSEKQDIFCDIGANIGTTSIYFKKKVDREIRILAFEPSAENYKMLKINMMLNDIEETDHCLVNKGISDKEEELYFAFDKFNTGGSHILRDGTGEERIRTIPFDDYIRKENIDVATIKYIWVDVEGFEPYFLKGGFDTLSKINVPIVVEFSPKHYKEQGCFHEYIDILSKLYGGYICMQDEEGTIHKINELYQYDSIEKEYLMDLFLLKNAETRKVAGI